MSKEFDAYLRILEQQERVARWAQEFCDLSGITDDAMRAGIIDLFGAYAELDLNQLEGVIKSVEFVIRKKGFDMA